MIRQAVDHGLRIFPKHKEKIEPEPDGTMHNSRGSTLTRLYRRKVRSWNTATHGKPVLHESVLKRTRNEQNTPQPPYRPWIMDDSLEHEVEPWKQGFEILSTVTGAD